ncbi:MAG TPA: hypothetical protein VH482_00705 [Thermomicrobiales bacterium]
MIDGVTAGGVVVGAVVVVVVAVGGAVVVSGGRVVVGGAVVVVTAVGNGGAVVSGGGVVVVTAGRPGSGGIVVVPLDIVLILQSPIKLAEDDPLLRSTTGSRQSCSKIASERRASREVSTVCAREQTAWAETSGLLDRSLDKTDTNALALVGLVIQPQA